jgi:hypothetical protein
MKTCILLILFLGVNFLVEGQDYIINKNGEKIDCTIQKEDSTNIYFTFRWNGKVVNTMLSRQDILEYGPISQYHGVKINTLTVGKPTSRISLYGGGGYLFTSTPKILLSDESSYVNKMRLGLSYGAEISIFPKDVFGFGLKYLVYQTNNISSVLLVEDNITTTYVGPSLSLKRATGLNGMNFIFGLSVGYLKNSNSGTKSAVPMYITGSAFGVEASMGLDYRFGAHFAVGVDFSVLGGDISKYILNSASTTLSSSDNLLMADLTGGIRFYF